jgi:hypothetical protein
LNLNLLLFVFDLKDQDQVELFFSVVLAVTTSTDLT